MRIFLFVAQQEMSSLSVLPSAASPAAPSVDIQFINTTISALRANVSLINDTLSKKIQWAQEDLATHQVSLNPSLHVKTLDVTTPIDSLTIWLKIVGGLNVILSISKFSYYLLKLNHSHLGWRC